MNDCGPPRDATARLLRKETETMPARQNAPFPNKILPYVLLAPQLAITFVFFLWPAGVAIYHSVLRQDPFGLKSTFVGLANFERVLSDPGWLDAVWVTVIFSFAVMAIALGIGLALAVAADALLKGARFYEIVLVLPYAIAPAVAGVLWYFLMHPSLGIVAGVIKATGHPWNYQINGGDALALVVIAAAWKQVSYNFLFFLAGLQAIPRTLIEAAAIDGAGPWRRFRHVVWPLISPTTFFLLVVNLIYAIFDTFGVIHATTLGGPGQATSTLVYEVYRDGFIGLDLGGSSAQSVILMSLVIVLTVLQFRYVQRRVTY